MRNFLMLMMMMLVLAGCDSEPKRYTPTVVSGVVKDAQTGAPLEGIGWRIYEVRNFVVLEMARGKTDIEGRFTSEVSCCNGGQLEVNGYAGNNPIYEIHTIFYKLGIVNELTIALPRVAGR